MTAPMCATGCGRPAPVSVICGHCSWTLERDLGEVPAFRAELEVSLMRQSVSASRSGGRSAETPMPFDVGASEVLSVLRSTLVGWVRVVVEEAGESWPADTLDGMSVLLLGRIGWLARHQAGPEAVDEIGSAMALARRAVDRRAERWYAGPCEEATGDGRCPGELYAKPKAEAVRCPRCGTEHDVAARREWLRASTDGHLGTVSEISALSRHMLGEMVTPAMIRGYAFRGVLAPHGTVRDPRGREVPLYRLGEVFAAAANAAADPRAKRDARKAAREAEEQARHADQAGVLGVA